VLASLVSPWVYRWFQSFAAEDSLLDAPFHRVTARLVLIFVAALLYPAYKISGMQGRDSWGLRKASSRWRWVWIGLAIGVGSMLVTYLLGAGLGVFEWDTRGKSASYLARKSVQAICGGLFIGFFEEILFRGYIQTALKKSLGLLPAILIGSFFFSIVHFMRPTDPAVTDQWYSGFLLLNNLFARAGDSFLQEACTLFCMGAVLATLTHWMRSVWLAIGLHAGWVWVMMLFRLFAENQKNMTWLYGESDWVSRGWIGPAMAAIVWIAAVLTRKKWIAQGEKE
jgi:membrane protease YdiL (CAAX protease family)